MRINIKEKENDEVMREEEFWKIVDDANKKGFGYIAVNKITSKIKAFKKAKRLQ